MALMMVRVGCGMWDGACKSDEGEYIIQTVSEGKRARADII